MIPITPDAITRPGAVLGAGLAAPRQAQSRKAKRTGPTVFDIKSIVADVLPGQFRSTASVRQNAIFRCRWTTYLSRCGTPCCDVLASASAFG